MPKIDLAALPVRTGSGYPPAFQSAVAGREVRDLTKGGGLTDFIANQVTLPPGAWSSQRHWHEDEDELVVILSGEAVLVDDHGSTRLGPGEVADFPKNDGNGHHLRNESDRDCVFLAIGLADRSLCHYPDIDLLWSRATGDTHRDGTPY